jgi:hypothetical protein
MTGYTVHTGTSKKFASGWDQIFGDQPEKDGGKSRKKKAAKKKTAAKKSAAKSGAKKKKTARKKKASRKSKK